MSSGRTGSIIMGTIMELPGVCTAKAQFLSFYFYKLNINLIRSLTLQPGSTEVQWVAFARHSFKRSEHCRAS